MIPWKSALTCIFQTQGEIGEPGQKGSKGDKGENVSSLRLGEGASSFYSLYMGLFHSNIQFQQTFVKKSVNLSCEFKWKKIDLNRCLLIYIKSNQKTFYLYKNIQYMGLRRYFCSANKDNCCFSMKNYLEGPESLQGCKSV